MTAPASSDSSKSLTPSAIPIRGRFLWHELLARDASAATTFYPAVVGWTVLSVPFPGATGTYTMFINGEAGVAGIQPCPAEQLPNGVTSRWMPYMGTDDADATFREAISLGAQELMPLTDIPTIGRIAALRDPQGAQFAIIAPEPAGMPETLPTVGEFAWHDMACDDPQASFAFYQRLFGWESKRRLDMGKDGIYEIYGRGQFEYGGFMRRRAEQPPTSWNSYVRVADLDAACDAIRSSGGRILAGPHPVPSNDRIVLAVDDQGAIFSLVGAVK